MASLVPVRQLAGVCGALPSPADSAGWNHKDIAPLRCWPPQIGARAGPKRLAEASGELQIIQVLSRNQEEPLQPEGNRNTTSDSGPWPAESGELQEGSKSYRGDFYRKHNLVVACVVDFLRPLLERLGLSVVQSPHGVTKASFAIVEQRDLAASVQGKIVSCLPVHVRVGYFAKSRGQVIFSRVRDHPGLVLLVHARTSSPQPLPLDCFEAVHVYTGRSILSRTINLRPGVPSKYALHRADTAEELGHTIVDFASRVFQGEKEGPSKTVMRGGAVLSVSDVLPLPTLQQMTIPAAGVQLKSLEAYDAFFGGEGLLAGRALQGLLTADRKQCSRTGDFVLTFEPETNDVQLTAHSCRGTWQSSGGVLFRTAKVGRTNACAWWKPFQAGEVDIAVCYTPCLSGIYLVPDFALAHWGARRTEQAPGQVAITVRPYGGGLEKTKFWNKFLVDCTASKEEVYARCRALLALAAEGKAKGWEAMPLADQFGLAPVTLSPPPQAPKQRKKQSSEA